MNKKQKKVIGITLLVLMGIVIFSQLDLLSLFTFEFGFSPYGESINQITDLSLISKSVSTSGTASSKLIFSSKYWDIEQNEVVGCSLSQFGCASQGRQLFSGSDLEFISATPQGGGADKSNPLTTTIIKSTEDFSERDFKATFISSPGGSSGTVWKFFGQTSISISLIGNSGEVGVVSHNFVLASSPPNLNVVISPSVINNKVNIFENGIKTKEIIYSGDYKIKINMDTGCGSVAQAKGDCSTKITMKEPSFKQQFGCTTKPNEQTYVAIFNEGDRININKLEEFTKFCLAESPAKIYTNIGGTTDTEVLLNIIDGEEMVVPIGQVWSIEYIGEKTIFKTDCEENELFNLKEDICMARTVVSLKCAEGSEFDFERGICIIETKPQIFNPSTLETHQELQEEGKFRFTHILQDSQTKTPINIRIGENNFNSLGVVYEGDTLGTVAYPKESSNWFAEFNYNGMDYRLRLNEQKVLDNVLSVRLTDIGGYRHRERGITDFKAEYTFLINTNFLTPSYENKVIKVSNSYQSFDGGIVITKIDNVGKTTIDKVEKILVLGDTNFNIDTKDLIELKARPFIKVNTPIFDYSIDGKKAITVKNFEEVGEPTSIPEENLNLILTIIGLVALVVVLIVLFVKFK